jgi:hypothetical protein
MPYTGFDGLAGPALRPARCALPCQSPTISQLISRIPPYLNVEYDVRCRIASVRRVLAAAADATQTPQSAPGAHRQRCQQQQAGSSQTHGEADDAADPQL